MSLGESTRSAGRVVKQSLKVIRSSPQVMIYPYAALFFVSVTYPLVSASIFARWYDRIFVEAGSVAPHRLSFVLGLVGFSVFYTALVTSFFTTAVSAEVLTRLENRPIPPFYGMLRALKNFFRVARFAILAVFFVPVGIYAQRRKLPRGIISVLGSSVTLSMAQVAPAILATNKRFGATIRDAIDTLGQSWREGLILKIGMYSAIFLVIVLPKLIQEGFFDSPSASNVGWLISLQLAASSYAIFKVINAIFTAVLYHRAKNGRGERT